MSFKRKLICIIGPLPKPVNGCSLANKTFLEYIEKQTIFEAVTIDTNVDLNIQGVQGKFSWIKFFSFIRVYLGVYKIFKVQTVYMTPGQSFLGILKYAPFILLAWFLNKPIIMHLHGNFLGKQYQLLKGLRKKVFKFLISRSSAGIVLSHSLKGNFFGILAKEKIYIVENFANNELTSNEIVQKDATKLKLLWLSNLMEEKGILDFLDALIVLKNRGVQFEAKLVGKIEEGLEEAIQEKFTQLGHNVEYLGTLYGVQKKDRLLEANVFIFPTYYTMEGQPIALIEAMATGNVIVTTNHAGIPDIVGSDNGYLLPPRNVGALVNQIESISQNLYEEIEKFSKHNQIYVKNNFTEIIFGQKIMKVISDISNLKNK